jgi:hypothetical protein
MTPTNIDRASLFPTAATPGSRRPLPRFYLPSLSTAAFRLSSKPSPFSPPCYFPSSTSPLCSALPCSSRHHAAPRQAMLSTSHQAKRHRSCNLMPGFTSSERAPSSCCRVSKHQSIEPPQIRFANGSEPPAPSHPP